jgi:pSer/pThr/pTyr-binding forkhead associated (FHA) protein
VIGRADAAVQLTDPQASRHHAVIRRSGDKFIIYDLGSTAGTIVDGQKVEGIKIKGTDTITLGGSTIVVMEPNAG